MSDLLFKGVKGTYQISSGIPLRGNSPFLPFLALLFPTRRDLEDSAAGRGSLPGQPGLAYIHAQLCSSKGQRSCEPLQGLEAMLLLGDPQSELMDEQVPTNNLKVSTPLYVKLLPRAWVGGL